MPSDESLVLATTPLTSHRDPVGADRVRAIVDAAADAGFSGVSIWTAHHDFAVADGMSSEEYYAYHGERGLSVPSSEVVMVDWATSDARALAATNSHILDVSARAGASTVITAFVFPELPPVEEVVAGLRTLCDLAAERGMTISLEFLPFTGIPTIADAVRLVDAADRDNLGFVLDTWHWFRQPGGPDVATLRTIPPERIHLFQLNDAPAEPAEDLMAESMARLLPGEGAIDIVGLIGVLDEMGAEPVVISEVFSAARLAQLEPAENARRQYAALTAVLEQYRQRSERALAEPSSER
jgi:sugar phosphate isomerase/epimerase